jgi:hypothetical protein
VILYLGKKEEENGIDRNLETTDVPTNEEVEAAVNKLKNNKAPDPDGIPREILRKDINVWKTESTS